MRAITHHTSAVDITNAMAGGNLGSYRISADKLSKGNLINLEQSHSRNISLVRHWSLGVSIEKVIGHGSSLEMSESFSEGVEKESDTNVPPILEWEYMQGVLINELVLDNSFSQSSRREKCRQKKLVKKVKRPGKTINKGHGSYDLTLSL